MVCLGNMCVDTLHKGDNDDDDDDDDNNNNNNNNVPHFGEKRVLSATYSISKALSIATTDRRYAHAPPNLYVGIKMSECYGMKGCIQRSYGKQAGYGN